jgi:hypothetical protein
VRGGGGGGGGGSGPEAPAEAEARPAARRRVRAAAPGAHLARRLALSSFFPTLSEWERERMREMTRKSLGSAVRAGPCRRFIFFAFGFKKFIISARYLSID